jgi:heme/copper-type cytochrome/quinol oxidase subunit 2
MGVVSILLLSMGIYLLLLARRTSKSGQYPPPGMKVIRDTRVRTGDKAKLITILMIVSSGILILFAFLFLYFPWAFEKVFQKKRSPEIKPNTGIEQRVFTQ